MLCTLDRLIPVFSFDLAPGETQSLPRLAGYDGPVIGIAGPDGTVENDSGSVLNWLVPLPSAEERKTLWQSQIGEPDLARRLAEEHVHSAGRIAELAETA